MFHGHHGITNVFLKILHMYGPIQCISSFNDSFVFIDWFIVFKATFSNISAISWRPVLVVEEAGAPGEDHRRGPTYNPTVR